MTSNIQTNKSFYGRDWVFGKLMHCLENRANAKTSGVLVVGGSGSGKTALCSEIIWPKIKNNKSNFLNKRLLAYHLCQACDYKTLSLRIFVNSISDQILNYLSVNKKRLFLSEEASILSEKIKNELDPKQAFSILLNSLNQLDPPPTKNLFILVDSIDEIQLQQTKKDGLTKIADLLGEFHHNFPPWLLLVASARRQNRIITHLFTGFKKISLDDLKKPHVLNDMQQYVLNRLEEGEKSKLVSEAAESFNQLYIKSNGCLLYLEKVMDNVIGGLLSIEEIKSIPGTLNGLYLWMCQRIFKPDEFQDVKPLINLMLASQYPLSELEIFECLLSRKEDEYLSHMQKLADLIVENGLGEKSFFHHSFAEWLLDVKHCTNRFLCNIYEGHALILLYLSSQMSTLTSQQLNELAFHACRSLQSEYFKHFCKEEMCLWLLSCKLPIEKCFSCEISDDFEANLMFVMCGASFHDDLMEEEFERQKLTHVHQESEEMRKKEIYKNEFNKEKQKLDLLNNNVVTATKLAPRASIEFESETSNNSIFNSNDLNHSGKNGRNGSAQNDEESIPQTCSITATTSVNNSNNMTSSATNARDSNTPTPSLTDPNTQLAEAVKTNNLSLARNLLSSQKININQSDKDGWTLLRSAAWVGSKEMVQLLLSYGVSVNQTDKDSRTALRAASWGGHEGVVELLLKSGADVNKADNEGRTALIAAAYMGHSGVVERLLREGVEVDHEDIDGRTALSVASMCSPVTQQHIKVVNLLLEHGSNPNHKDHEGMTPLLVAAFEGSNELCEVLLEADGDVDHQDAVGRCALQAAVQMGHEATVSLLLFWGAAVDMINREGRTVLGEAAMQGNVEVMKLLLNRGLDETHRDNSGWTPLHIAAYHGRNKGIEVLLEAGAKLMETDNDGRVAMVLASMKGNLQTVLTLLNRGTPTESHGHDGRTSLRCAIQAGHNEVANLLISRGANINCRDSDGRSMLHALSLIAHNKSSADVKENVKKDCVKRAAMLLDRGLDVNMQDLEGRTVLHLATLQRNNDIIRLLVCHKNLDINCEDSQGKTPLHMSASRGNVELSRLFLKLGADVNKCDVKGQTALWLAARDGRVDVVALLLEWHANVEVCDVQGRNAYRIASKHNNPQVLKLLRDHSQSTQAISSSNQNNKVNESDKTAEDANKLHDSATKNNGETKSVTRCHIQQDEAIYSVVAKKPTSLTPSSLTSGFASSTDWKNRSISYNETTNSYEAVRNGPNKNNVIYSSHVESSRAHVTPLRTEKSPRMGVRCASSYQSSSGSSGCESALGRLSTFFQQQQKQQILTSPQQLTPSQQQNFRKQHSKSIDYSCSAPFFHIPPPPPSNNNSSLINSLLSPVRQQISQQNTHLATSSSSLVRNNNVRHRISMGSASSQHLSNRQSYVKSNNSCYNSIENNTSDQQSNNSYPTKSNSINKSKMSNNSAECYGVYGSNSSNYQTSPFSEVRSNAYISSHTDNTSQPHTSNSNLDYQETDDLDFGMVWQKQHPTMFIPNSQQEPITANNHLTAVSPSNHQQLNPCFSSASSPFDSPSKNNIKIANKKENKYKNNLNGIKNKIKNDKKNEEEEGEKEDEEEEDSYMAGKETPL